MGDFFSGEQGSISKFNEASLKLLRINNEQIRINQCNINLLGFDLEVCMHNYEIKFNCLGSLFSEISAQLTDPEITKVKELRKEIKKLMIEKPVHYEQENMVTHEKIKRLNKISWNKVEELLFDYDLLVKKLMKKHGMALPESDDPELAGYR